MPPTLFIKKVLLGKCTGINFVDSTPPERDLAYVCKEQMTHKLHRSKFIELTFKKFARPSQTLLDWRRNGKDTPFQRKNPPRRAKSRIKTVFIAIESAATLIFSRK